MKFVLNKCEGRFGLSDTAIVLYARMSGINLIKEIEQDDANFRCWKTDTGEIFDDFWKILRFDTNLIEVVERLGKYASDKNAQLEIVEIPDDCTWWKLSSCKGFESIIECARRW